MANESGCRPSPSNCWVMLLERPGQLVTREEICQKLWSTDTFVDFDHSLGTTINKIREVLNDSAAKPRFVETIPRRGYRFIASVTAVAEDPPSVPVRSAWAAWGCCTTPSLGLGLRIFKSGECWHR
jgi:DNA-binding winged helix-turn-helix (wHTH) protein